MRRDVTVEVSAADRARLEAVIADRNSPQKHVWRAKIIRATADGLGTAEIMRRSGKSKPSVWRWQERFMTDGVDGLLRVCFTSKHNIASGGETYDSPPVW